MIDTREPPDGDFARYVENLSRLPPGHGVNPGPRAPDLKALLALGSVMATVAGKHPALASAIPFRQGLQSLLLRALRAIGGVAIAAMLGGIALIVLSDMAELPFRIDPTTGLKVFAGGFAVLWLARAARARIDR